MYRKFWLVNSLGKKYLFSDTQDAETDVVNKNVKVFLDNPNGLGFEKEYSSVQLGNTENITSQDFKFLDFNAELLFYDKSIGNQYEDYFNFIQFIKYKPLELHCKTPNSNIDYYSDIIIKTIEKSDVNYSDNMLHVNILFHRLSQWLTNDEIVIGLTNQTIETGKYYNLIRPYHYAGKSFDSVEIINNGTSPVGFTFEVVGAVTDYVQFTLSQNSEVYGSCKILGSNYDYIKVNSVDDEQEIYLANGSTVISNPTSYQDLSIADGKKYITFIKLNVGTSIFNFTCGNINTFTGQVYIKFKPSYISI